MHKLFIHAASAWALATTYSAAHAEIVVIVNPKSAAANMTGKDTSFAPFDLPESETLRNEFYKKVAGKDGAQVKTIWARLIFTGKVQPPKQIGSASDAVKQVAGNDKAIAYVDRSAVDASVKPVLTLN